MAAEKAAAEKAAEKNAAEKTAAAKAASAKVAADEANVKKALGKGLGVVSGKEGGGKALPAETVSDDTLSFLKNYK